MRTNFDSDELDYLLDEEEARDSNVLKVRKKYGFGIIASLFEMEATVVRLLSDPKGYEDASILILNRSVKSGKEKALSLLLGKDSSPESKFEDLTSWKRWENNRRTMGLSESEIIDLGNSIAQEAIAQLN